MGMFDHVDFDMDCPRCGELVNTFQTKYGGCTLDVVSPGSVLNFYTSCEGCGQWIEFTKPVPQPQPPRKLYLSDLEALGFVMTLKGRWER